MKLTEGNKQYNDGTGYKREEMRGSSNNNNNLRRGKNYDIVCSFTVTNNIIESSERGGA